MRAFVGTWQENFAKSHHVISSAFTYSFFEETDAFVTIVRGGTPLRDRVRFDGKDYPVTGDTASDSRSYKRVNPSTLQLTNKKEGKVVAAGKIVVSKDGKTRTVTISGTTSDGKKYKSVGVYDKQ